MRRAKDEFWERVFKYELSKGIRELSTPKGITLYVEKREILASKWVDEFRDISEQLPPFKKKFWANYLKLRKSMEAKYVLNRRSTVEEL